jgi:hypothetical protein
MEHKTIRLTNNNKTLGWKRVKKVQIQISIASPLGVKGNFDLLSIFNYATMPRASVGPGGMFHI